MKKNYKTVLIDTTWIPPYEDYVDFCKNNGIEPSEENSDDYWEYVSDSHENDWDYLRLNLGHGSDNANEPCVITGTLGLWNGNKTVLPVRCETLFAAIKRCFGQSIDNIVAIWEDGEVHVTAYHHDGENHFTINRLSKRGLQASEHWHNNVSSKEDLHPANIVKYHGYPF